MKDKSNGWIKLHRDFTKFEWYQDANTMRLFLHLLITANHKKVKWQGNTIGRGQLITSHGNLAKGLGLADGVANPSSPDAAENRAAIVRKVAAFVGELSAAIRA